MTAPEDAARDLLRQAGDTIDVDAGGPLDVTLAPRRRWPVIAAAAAVALIVGAAALSLAGDRGPTTEQRPTATSPTPTIAPQPGTVPAVFGLRTDAAADLLTDLGYAVDVRVQPCRNGFASPFPAAIITRPYPGTALPPGGTVRLLTTNGCPLATLTIPVGLGWSLVDLARSGTTEGTRFAPQVDLTLGDTTETITAEEAADPDSWTVCDGDDCRSALAEIDRVASTPVLMNGVPYEQDPYLTYREAGARTWRFDIAVPTDGPDIVDLVTVTLDDDGRISAVDLTEPRPVTSDVAPGVAPSAAAVADQLVAFARGTGGPPPLADRVGLYHNDLLFRRLSRRTLASPAYWVYTSCPPDSPCISPAGISPLRTLAALDGPAAMSPTPSTCPPHPVTSELDLEYLTLVRLDEPEPASCDAAWAVEVYVDTDGRIATVNLLTGPDYQQG